jgi:hypothetical protein
LVDEALVPAVVEFDLSTSETTGDGTLTVVVRDPGGVIDPALRVQFYVTQNGIRALESASTAPSAGVTTGTYTKTKALDEKHVTLIEPIITLLDASVIQPGAQTFDADKVANVENLDVATDGPNGTVMATFDSDTVTGAGTGGGRYRIDGGAWTTFDVNATTRVASFVVALSAVATQLVEVQGKNAAAEWGPSITTRVPLFAGSGTASGPTLTVTPTPGTSSYSIAWTGTGTVQLSINGGSYGTPSASPISVTRTSNDQVYAFKATAAGQTIGDSITVPSLEKGTDVPDLTVVAGTPTATQTPFTVSATNPSGGTAPTITVTPTNCTMVIGGSTFSTAQTVSSGTVVTVNRPSSTQSEQATIRFRAAIAGAGAEEISRTVPTALALGPSLSLTVVPGPTSYSIGYTATGTVQYRVDNGSLVSPGSNPFTIGRNAVGGADQVVTVTATADGQTTSSPVTVPAQSDNYTVSLSAPQPAGVNYPTNTLVAVTWTASGFLSGTTFDLAYDFDDGATLGNLTNTSSGVQINVPSLGGTTKYRITLTAIYSGKTVVTKLGFGGAIPI